MPKKQAETSNAALDRQDAGSVYDFLYHDARRVGSFLAQLNPDGHLQSRRRTRQVGESTTSTSNVKGGAGVPGLVKVGSEAANQVQNRHDQSADETFDPLWANALALLDHLTQRDLMSRSMHDAGIGQFVLLTGSLKCVNLKALAGMWGSDALLKSFVDQEGNAKLDQVLGAQLIQALPHGVQAHFMTRGDNPSVSWMELDDANLIIPASSLMVKYGTWLTGEWTVFGIKDAIPDAGPVIDVELEAEIASDVGQAAASRHQSPFGVMAEALAPRARLLMGRPGPFYGLTPILVFREVKAAC